MHRLELFIARSEIELLHKTFLIWILTNLNPEPRRARRQAVGISKIWKMNESCEMHSMAEWSSLRLKGLDIFQTLITYHCMAFMGPHQPHMVRQLQMSLETWRHFRPLQFDPHGSQFQVEDTTPDGPIYKILQNDWNWNRTEQISKMVFYTCLKWHFFNDFDSTRCSGGFSNGPLKHFEILRKWKKKEGTPRRMEKDRKRKDPKPAIAAL